MAKGNMSKRRGGFGAGYVYNFKETVEAVASLPENPVYGDIYKIKKTGEMVIWDGNDWCGLLDFLGIVDENMINLMDKKADKDKVVPVTQVYEGDLENGLDDLKTGGIYYVKEEKQGAVALNGKIPEYLLVVCETGYGGSTFQVRVGDFGEGTKYSFAYRMCKPRTPMNAGGWTEWETYVTGSDYAVPAGVPEGAVGGIVKVLYNNGVSMNNRNELYLEEATQEEIDLKEKAKRHAITPRNLEYAVKSVGDGVYTKKSELDALKTELEELKAMLVGAHFVSRGEPAVIEMEDYASAVKIPLADGTVHTAKVITSARCSGGKYLSIDTPDKEGKEVTADVYTIEIPFYATEDGDYGVEYVESAGASDTEAQIDIGVDDTVDINVPCSTVSIDEKTEVFNGVTKYSYFESGWAKARTKTGSVTLKKGLHNLLFCIRKRNNGFHDFAVHCDYIKIWKG